MLRRIDEQGRTYDLTKVPHEKNFEQWLALLQGSQLTQIQDYIDQRIDTVDKFSVATLFGGVWDEPLSFIYDALGHHKDNSALLLGRIVLDRVIRSESQWLSTKTVLGSRDLATAFYWKN
jgi:hypothetical protein